MMPKLHELIEHARQEEKLPSIISDRCVHSIIEVANCQSCVEVCPKGAWVLDDEALHLDTAACDGCGLCAPVCSEGAITIQHQMMIGHWQGSSLALCACEYAHSSVKDGIIPCLHAVGLQEIMGLYQQGIMNWVVTAGNCSVCERGQGPHLFDRLNLLNRILKKRGNRRIRFSRRSLLEWQKITLSISEYATGPQLSRRGFLRGILNSSLQHGLELLEPPSDGKNAFVPPGQLLPKSTDSQAWPNLPIIDIRACNGCDACTRACPHQAIQLIESEDRAIYQLNPEACTGCGVCTDICDQRAVTLHKWKEVEQQLVMLEKIKCHSCGIQFHLPSVQSGHVGNLCRICSQRNHHKNLYQVLN
ncbi:MAG: 4Fe-4S dicluster domain-containing protein [Candidatus Thiodiazotropha sp. (ex Lucinoma annulata)]|nr:4Fe-4S dicluster domain-containing protein [Candidatus Thiodiazotropha sp. (ex Lucinoma borealis)]MCU7870544.1 4Fe-4S dicluster domain-containing protein [Candidatus Thiodiazotropha sp. (ex Lucinoma borealis)]MCU7876686.1 4Fe-4S dicluster domain-containing protein [Candidatus Thiodiazotropha sp. (ex Lucinoma borealis)]MCU7883991.1 4Fe-4S dicluster domain-containing protein [Candidatus Thiodiazotropha sp. (ex Lucinoma annulata)]